MKIRNLSISARSRACLLNVGYENLEDLRNVTDGELLEIHNLNRKYVAEIRAAIEDYFQEDLQELEIYFDEEANIKSDVLSMSIDDLEFDVRTYNCLKRAHINTLKELCELTYDDMLHIRNLGRRSLKDILDKLDELGLSLKSVENNEVKQDDSENKNSEYSKNSNFTENCYQVSQDSNLKVEVEEAYWQLINDIYTPFLKIRITNVSDLKVQIPSVKAIFRNLLLKSSWGDDYNIEYTNAKQMLRPGYGKIYMLKAGYGFTDKWNKESLPEVVAQLFVNDNYYGVVEISKSYRAGSVKPLMIAK